MFLLAFNWIGYRLLSGFMENKADIALETRIDQSDYDETTLIEIRVPLNAPYLSDNTTEFERYDGELELDGIHYKYVKRKVVNGELVLLCLPNKSKTEIQNSREEFFKLVNDLNHSQNKSKSTTSTYKSVTTEYKETNNLWTIQPVAVTPIAFNNAVRSDITPGYNSAPEQPPKA